ARFAVGQPLQDAPARVVREGNQGVIELHAAILTQKGEYCQRSSRPPFFRRPEYFLPSEMKEISSPRTVPASTKVLPFEDRVPVSFWYFCASVTMPCGVSYVPSTRAGTIQRNAVHQEALQPAS